MIQFVHKNMKKLGKSKGKRYFEFSIQSGNVYWLLLLLLLTTLCFVISKYKKACDCSIKLFFVNRFKNMTVLSFNYKICHRILSPKYSKSRVIFFYDIIMLKYIENEISSILMAFSYFSARNLGLNFLAVWNIL